MTDLRQALSASAPSPQRPPDLDKLRSAATRRRRHTGRLRFGAALVVAAALLGGTIAMLKHGNDGSTVSTVPQTAPVATRTSPDGREVSIWIDPDDPIVANITERLDIGQQQQASIGKTGAPSECYPAYALGLRIAGSNQDGTYAVTHKTDQAPLASVVFPILPTAESSPPAPGPPRQMAVIGHVNSTEAVKVTLVKGADVVDSAISSDGWVILFTQVSADFQTNDDQLAQLDLHLSSGNTTVPVSHTEQPGQWC